VGNSEQTGETAPSGVDESLSRLEAQYPPRDLPEGAEVSRVAPSPTGKPHIGTALQAVIDYALASRTSGVFILRIEDTDRERLVPGAMQDIVAALDWLGVPAHEGPPAGGSYGPYVESERLTDYQIVAEWLVAHGAAYLCFCTLERLDEMRKQQIANKQPTRYDRRCRTLTPEERQGRLDNGERAVVRLAMPLDGVKVYQDPVRGPIEFELSEQDDPVILKSDGYPTYHLAAMVDDHFMRVTTVVRGEEWISSTPKHLVLIEALGWQAPRIVHTPILRDAQGRKLSKRSGDTSVSHYRSQGYLPEAFRNFLTRLVWVHPDDKDVYPYEDFIDGMRIEDLPKTGPFANPALLDFISGEWLRTLDASTLYDAVVDWLTWLLEYYTSEGIEIEVVRKQERVTVPVPREELEAFHRAFMADRSYSERVLSLEPERYHKLGDIVLDTPLYYEKLFQPASPEMLVEVAQHDWTLARELLTEYRDWFTGDEAPDAWEARMDEMWQRRELKRGVPFMLVRVATTGSKRTPPLHAVIDVLGPEEVKRRLNQALETLDASANEPELTSGHQ
jgi:glutamyl-tRNA synthetase